MGNPSFASGFHPNGPVMWKAFPCHPDKRVLLTWFVLELCLESVQVSHVWWFRLVHVTWHSRASCAWRGMRQGDIWVLHQGFGGIVVELWNNYSIRHWYWSIHFELYRNMLLQKTSFTPIAAKSVGHDIEFEKFSNDNIFIIAEWIYVFLPQ